MSLDLSNRSFTKIEYANYVDTQLNHFYPDGHNNKIDLSKNIDEALDRTAFSIKHINLKGYTDFNILHSDLYAQFIYFLSNTVWNKSQNENLSTKLFYLNKTLHGLNCTYDTLLPDIFILIHAIGTVLGKAKYSNYFVACQNVTVGSDKGYSPIMSEGVYMGPGSSLIGNSIVGKYAHFAINAVLMDQEVKGESVLVGSSPNILEKKLRRNLITELYFKNGG
jgi:serine O-acetyltransferase